MNLLMNLRPGAHRTALRALERLRALSRACSHVLGLLLVKNVCDGHNLFSEAPNIANEQERIARLKQLAATRPEELAERARIDLERLGIKGDR